MSAADEEEGRSRSRSRSSSSGSSGGGGAQQRERSATFAGSKCLELLGLLRSAKHAGRIKALRRFQDYMQQFKPEFYDDDVELLLVGSVSLDGLVPWCGYKSSHARGEEALKTTSRAVLHLLHWLVAIYKDDEASSGGSSVSSSNVFLDKFLELPPALLEKMELGMHVRAASGDADGATEAFELLSLLLMRHKGPDADAGNAEDGAAGSGQIVRLEVLLPESEAQGHFTRWLQQSTSEQQLIDRVNEEQRAALVAAAAAASALKAPPGLLGTTAGSGAGAGAASAPSLDPLGLHNNLDLVAAEQLRAQSSVPGAAGGKGVGALLGAKDRMFLLQRLQQAALGGGQGTGAGPAAGKGGAGGAKYTRNKARALKSAAAAGHGAAAASASIVPQDEAFDPALFLTIVHGASSFEDLRRGQENLEKGLGTQAGQLQQLVRQHYDAFARCAEGIQWFRHMVEEEFFRKGGGSGAGDGGGGEGAKIAHLLEIVAGTQEGARELFRPLLERMDSARSLRAARLLLQRLARVLDVPGRMAQLEAQGRYEEVVREYERVRTLPSGPGPGPRAGLLGRVQLQAEAVADRLRGRLRGYVGAAAHPFEDLVQTADLLARLGPGKGPAGAKGGNQGQNQEAEAEAEEEQQEPLLFTFARQVELLGKGLDALEAWYANGLQAIGEQEHPSRTGGWQQRSSHSRGDENAADEEEDDDDVDDSLEDDCLSAAARSSAALGAIGGSGKDKDDEDEDDPMLLSPLSRFGGAVDDGLGFSPRFGVDSVEHRASSFRLQCTRRLARLGLRSLPTLLRLAALVAEELADVRVVWVPGQYGFYVTSSSPSGKGRLATGTSAGQQERTAASAALEQVGLALQRISKAMHRAMFGEGGRARQQPSRSPRQQQQQQQQQQPAAATSVADSVRHRPLDLVYFREGLRAAAQLYEGIFALQQQQEEAVSAVDSTSTAELATAVLPPLRSLVEDAQRRQAQSVLDRVGEGAVRLCQREDWARCSGWHAAAGTNLPQAFLEMATLALEDLAATLPRPSWCAAQVAQGLDRALTRLLAALAALADGGAASASLVPRPLRLLALVGNCVQLHGLVLPSLAAAAQRLFEAEASSLAGPEAKGRVLALHDDCLRLYLEDKIVALEAALRDGWIVKGKGLAGVLSATGAGGQGGAMVPPGYLSRVLLILVQGKAETRELLGERALLTEDEDDGEEDEEPHPMGEVMARPPLYVDAVTRKLAQAAVTGLTARAAEWQSLRSALAASNKSWERARQRRQQVGALAHCASVEATFLVGALRPFVTAESTQAAKKRLEPLKLIAVDALGAGGGEDGAEDVTAAAATTIEEYTCASVEKALHVYVASLQ